MQDETIVELYWQRDESAIEATAKKYEGYLLKIAYNVLADTEDSKESVNDTYLAAWNSMPPHRPACLSAFLAKLTRRISIDIYRRKNRMKRKAGEYALSLYELSGVRAHEPHPQQSLDEKLLTEALNRFMETLGTEARAAFMGRYYFFDPLKEIARYMGVSEGKVKTLLHRTRLSLKEYLKKEGFELD